MIRATNAPRALRTLATALGLVTVGAPAAHAQWVTTYEQFYLQAPHNWTFRSNYQAADRMFNAFDYGHAILYETLWTKPDAPASVLEEKEYDFLTKRVLVKPPRVPLEEGAIEIKYVQLAPEAKQMFEWAHILHRQLYDVLADERLTPSEKDAEVARVIGYYKTRPDIAFSSRPKSMALMQEQPYSLAFRQKYPKFNGLIWAYHWLQVGLYEPLLVNATVESRQAGVRATVSRFWQMIDQPIATMPHQMPMTAAVAPAFAERYPEAAIIFDNLHSMHDVISDILANPSVPRDRKRAEILLAAERFRDDTSYVMTVEGWRTMSDQMGVENMGGPAAGFLPAMPSPTVTYGAVMQHNDRTGEMTGISYGEALAGHGAHAGMQHGTPAADTGAHAGMQHGTPAADTGAMDHAAMGHAMPAADSGMAAHTAQMMELHMRMMADTVIRNRMMADTSMRRMMRDMMERMPPDHRTHMEAMMRDAEARRAPRPTPARRPAARTAAPKTAAPKTAASPAAKPADPHAGHATPPARPPVRSPARPPADPHAGHRPPDATR